MPDAREKLVELLKENCHFGQKCPGECTGCMADHLIANGVTFAEDKNVLTNGVTIQRWIPVTERLPEVCADYLVVVKYKYDEDREYHIDTDVATYYPFDCADYYIDKRWSTFNDWYEGQQYIHITHWMPLPEAPKGDD